MTKEPAPPAQQAMPLALRVAAVALLATLLLLALMLAMPQSLVRYGLVGNVWYVLLIFLGLAAAVCLFSLFRSYAHYKGEVMNGTLEIGGPGALMLVVVGLGFWLAPGPVKKFDVSVLLKPVAGVEVFAVGQGDRLRLDLGADRRIENIGSKGEVRFVGIPADQMGQSVAIGLESAQWELAQPGAHIKLDTEAVYVAVRIKGLPLQGLVIDQSGRPVANARYRVADQSGVTDADGRLRITLPANANEAGRVMSVTAPGFEPWRNTVVPGGGLLTVQLLPGS